MFFDFVPRRIQGWPIWVDRELSDEEFVDCLEHVGILKASEMLRALGIWYAVGALLSILSSFLSESLQSPWRMW